MTASNFTFTLITVSPDLKTLYKCFIIIIIIIQSDHSADNVKFPDNFTMVRSTPAHVKCHSYHGLY